MHIQTRVVSATNKDLESMIERDLFRKDLYFRLGVIKVQIPSLNERRDDIMPLAKHFLYEFSRKFGKKFTGLSPDAERALVAYEWVGNVRELKNLMERGVLTGKGPELALRDLGIEGLKGGATSRQAREDIQFPPMPPTGIDLPSIEKSLDRHYIEEALKMAEGNESKAARFLNLNHHTFRYRKKRLQE